MASLFCALNVVHGKDLIDELDEIQNRIKFPNSLKAFTKMALRTSNIISSSENSISASDVYEFLEVTDAYRNPEKLRMTIEFHNCTNDPDLRAKTQLISDAFEVSKNIVYDEVVFEGLEGDAIKAKLDDLRIKEINLILK